MAGLVPAIAVFWSAVAAAPGDKTQILMTPHRLTDTEFHVACVLERVGKVLRAVPARYETGRLLQAPYRQAKLPTAQFIA
jgi:hypothetical protein